MPVDRIEDNNPPIPETPERESSAAEQQEQLRAAVAVNQIPASVQEKLATAEKKMRTAIARAEKAEVGARRIREVAKEAERGYEEKPTDRHLLRALRGLLEECQREEGALTPIARALQPNNPYARLEKKLPSEHINTAAHDLKAAIRAAVKERQDVARAEEAVQQFEAKGFLDQLLHNWFSDTNGKNLRFRAKFLRAAVAHDDAGKQKSLESRRGEALRAFARVEEVVADLRRVSGDVSIDAIKESCRVFTADSSVKELLSLALVQALEKRTLNELEKEHIKGVVRDFLSYIGGAAQERACYELEARAAVKIEKWLRDTLVSQLESFEMLREVHLYGEVSARQSFQQKLQLFRMCRETPAVAATLGSFLQTADGRFYEQLYEHVLTDREGHYADCLVADPRPESIRALLILLATEHPLQGYGSHHAVTTLKELTQRPDWPLLVDQAIEQFPEIASAKTLLLEFDQRHDPHMGYPGATEAVQPLALAIARSEASPAYFKHAITALPLLQLLEVLGQKQYVDASLVTIITDAVASAQSVDPKHALRCGKHLQKTLWSLVDEQPEEKRARTLARVQFYAEFIRDEAQTPGKLDFIAERDVYQALLAKDLALEDARALLEAGTNCPALLRQDWSMRNKFTELYKSAADVPALQEFLDLFGSLPGDAPYALMSLWFGDKVPREQLRARAVDAEIYLKPRLDTRVSSSPKLYFGSSVGVDLMRYEDEDHHTFRMETVRDGALGKQLLEYGHEDASDFKLHLTGLGRMVATNVINRVQGNKDEPLVLTEENWQDLLVTYTQRVMRDNNLPRVDDVVAKSLAALFDDPAHRDLCLEGLRGRWRAALVTPDPLQQALSSFLLADFIHDHGAVQFSQIETLGEFMATYYDVVATSQLTEDQLAHLQERLRIMEEKMESADWPNDSRTEYYRISREFLLAAPSLFGDFALVLSELEPPQLKRFVEEVYPLYRVRLALAEQGSKRGYKREELIAIRREIRNFRQRLQESPDSAFAHERELLEGRVTKLFKSRFGIIQVPETFSEEQIRTVANFSLYLTNMAHRDQGREAVLAYFLALQLNGKWSGFRAGESFPLAQYLTEELVRVLPHLGERKSPLDAGNLLASEEQLARMRVGLEDEVEHLFIGDVETVDTKLQNILLNVESLEDTELYPTALDRARVRLLQNHGHKKVGAVAAKLYQAKSGAPTKLSAAEKVLADEMEDLLAKEHLTSTPEAIKEHFQDGMKPFAVVRNILQFMEESRAKEVIAVLREQLHPGQEVSRIFGGMGEDFGHHSGAHAAPEDLDYLENLLNAQGDRLSPEDRVTAEAYLAPIRMRLTEVAAVYEKVRQKLHTLDLEKFHGPADVRAKFEELKRIVEEKEQPLSVISRMTGNLDTVVSHIRECLSCKTEGQNNDTNLTFGDQNKFFIFSRTEARATRSIADQIVFFLPITTHEGEVGVLTEQAFVFDRLYGTRKGSILMNHIEVVLKKIAQLKADAGAAPSTLFIPESTILSSTAPLEEVQQKVSQMSPVRSVDLVEVAVDVPPSYFGNNYIEFSAQSRKAGKRRVRGLLITCNS